METVVAVPVTALNELLREKSGRDVTLSTQAPDRIILTYAGKVDVPMLGEQGMNFSAGFKVLEVQGDRLVLQLDSGAAMNAAADLLAPRILERLPAGLVDSYANGRAVINLSAVPTLQKQLKSMDIVGFSLDEDAIRLRTVEKIPTAGGGGGGPPLRRTPFQEGVRPQAVEEGRARSGLAPTALPSGRR